MKIHYWSDLHLEFNENDSLVREETFIPVGDILILAGDIIPFRILHEAKWFFDIVSQNFLTVYFLPGNHEFYSGNAIQRSGRFFEKIRKNVFLLNNYVEVLGLGDVRLIFSTLWSYINPQAQREIEKRLNDFRLIKFGEKRLTTVQYNKFHQEAKSFLSEALNKPFDGKTIVVTHHVPTMMHYPEKYRGDVLNAAFASEMAPFIEMCGADYWIYGHSHANVEPFRIGDTLMLTNQMGYVSEGEHKDFNPAAHLIV